MSKDLFEQNIDNKSAPLADRLRPEKLADFVGQEEVISEGKLLRQLIEKDEVPSLILWGPPGSGKTTLARIIAQITGAKFIALPAVTSGVAELRVVIKDAQDRRKFDRQKTILFIDEVHRLNKMVEEVLYPAMEARSLDIIIGKGPAARTLQLELPPFTLIAATTRIALLSSPLRSRFSGGTFRLEFYTEPEIKDILARSAHLLGITAAESALMHIAKRSRFTPRIANHLLKRCRDVASVRGNGTITDETAEEALKLLDIDAAGLQSEDRRILNILINKFSGGPVGLTTLAAASSEEASTIEEVHEPYLLRLGFIERTPRGRIATRRAYEHLSIEPPRVLFR